MATNPRSSNGNLRRKHRARMKAMGMPCHICGKPIHYDEPSDSSHPLSFVIDEKIPSHIRDKELLICDGHHVMYVVGHRISEAYKVDDETKVVLRIDVDIIS